MKTGLIGAAALVFAFLIAQEAELNGAEGSPSAFPIALLRIRGAGLLSLGMFLQRLRRL